MNAPRTAQAIVVGSGIAGLTAALRAARNGVAVTLVTKDRRDHAATHYAQGGIAGVMTATDTTEEHLHDTLTAGAGLTDPVAARILVEEGPARIRDLIDAGVPFDRDAVGVLRAGLEGAHSHPRVLHAGGDATGAAIERTLLERLAESDVTVIEHAFVRDLVVTDGRVTGVEVLMGGLRRTLTADAVVLATGGAGQLYPHTTNPSVATGDGIALALRAGAAVADLEFVQFHPTVLAVGAPFLVSEAVRGEGATLIDAHGHRFARDAHPDGELAPRDIVARAIAAQDDTVFLDATGLGRPDTARFLATRFPTIDAAVRARGLDWATEPVPVTPAAHYLMGGVVTDLQGRTTLPGLYAVGETARTGVHGANRLASNSLLEGAVFGARVADAIVADAGADAGTWAGPAAPPIAAVGAVAAPEPSAPDAAGIRPFHRAALQELMWQHAGLVRDAEGLRHAADTLAGWSAEDDRATDAVPALEDSNLLRVATAVVDAARRRTASVGAHFRRDDAPAEPRDPASALPSSRTPSSRTATTRTASPRTTVPDREEAPAC
ncbi:L-aspartate oxidase [Microbacterium sp. cx-59]|uniref:L-aspartate oxidase n=1 Tax=Microbacterium sp. cx-59 TaxID=2891207 RepID=UPI001E55219F|nr:L-aspartate oxidase [Microbacterium sp. cx-59]MCC4906834.1 L-aspartate oxidase [Microbacterium sp. cx-59]